ncbi:hypothetical protein NMG60_11017506 [Bertholletia excelsa]
MASTDDEFSFPAISGAHSPPYFLDSPPLWRPAATAISSATTSPNPKQKKDHDDRQRKSFSCIEVGRRRKEDSKIEDEEEEKMDMLWEDFNFNEQVVRRAGGGGLGFESAMSSPGSGATDLGCVQALRLGPKSGPDFSAKKPGVVVLVKVLKKLFWLHSSRRTLHKQPRKVINPTV